MFDDTDLIQEIKNNSIDAHHQLCIRYLPLTKRLANRYLRRFAYMKDDIRGAAYVGLVQAVTWIATDRFHGQNAGGYINVTVNRYINEEIERNWVVPIPRSAFRKAKKDDEEVETPDYCDTDILNTLTYPDENWMETLDHIQEICKTKKEYQVLMMRIFGYSFREIGEKFGQSRAAPHLTMNKIRKRYENNA